MERQVVLKRVVYFQCRCLDSVAGAWYIYPAILLVIMLVFRSLFHWALGSFYLTTYSSRCCWPWKNSNFRLIRPVAMGGDSHPHPKKEQYFWSINYTSTSISYIPCLMHHMPENHDDYKQSGGMPPNPLAWLIGLAARLPPDKSGLTGLDPPPFHHSWTRA